MVSGPVGASVVDKVFTWTPSATQGDLTHPVVVAVSDGLMSVTNSFSLMVGGENAAPRFTGLSAEEGQELAEFSKNLSVADSDLPAQTLSVRLVQGPVGAEVSGGRFVWFPSEAQGPSTNRIVVAVSDGRAVVETAVGRFTGVLGDPRAKPAAGAAVTLSVRPECWTLGREAKGEIAVRGQIGECIYLGETAQYQFLAGAHVLKIFELNPRFADQTGRGELWASAAPQDVVVLTE
jgi:hypothetical protein